LRETTRIIRNESAILFERVLEALPMRTIAVIQRDTQTQSFLGIQRYSLSNGQQRSKYCAQQASRLSGFIYTLAVLLAVIFISPARVSGQATAFGEINGTVTDPSGAVVTKAHVTATNIGTSEEFESDSKSAGQYRIFNLLPAQYTLTIAAPGFKTLDLGPFKLDVGAAVTQNASLSVGAVSETVSVAAQGELLEATTVGISTVVEQQVVNDLPLNGRNYTSLIALTPGANGTRINGQFSDTNRYVLDGANNTSILSASSAYVPNLDLIQEFSIDSHSVKADEGGFLGATVSAATKSGTNRLSGDAWDFNRNNEFSARNPISNPPGVAFPPYHQNQFGAVVGGPVDIPKLYNGHDKTFFFFGYQGLRLNQKSFTYTRVPTSNELQGIFTNSLFFIASPNQVHLYDPATTTSGTPPTRTPFANDVIPSSRIDPLVVSYLQYILPTPNFTPTANFPTSNRLDLFLSQTVTNDYSIRIDHRISTHNNLWGRYSQVTSSVTSQPTATIQQVNLTPRKDLTIDWVHIFTPRIFVESNFAYQSFPSIINNVFPGGITQSLTGMGFNAAQLAAYGPADFAGTGTNTPGLYGHYETDTASPFSLNESLSWNVGRHNFKTGVAFSKKYFQNVSVGHHYTFSSVVTEDPNLTDPGAGNTGQGLASALLGLPSSVSLYQGNYTEQFWNWSIYAEDEWKARPNLTIDAGLRYDTYPTPNFTNGIINDWDANNGIWYIGGGSLPPACSVTPVAPCIPGAGTLASLTNGNMIQVAPQAGIIHAIHDNIGPRVGVAWNFRRNSVFRAGYGIYFDPESNTAQADQNSFGSWPSSTNVNLSYNTVGSPLTTINTVDGQSLSPETTGVPWGTQSYFYNPTNLNPRSQQWNVDLQQQFAKDLVATVSYVGSLQTHVPLELDGNQATVAQAGNAAAVNALRPWPFYGTDTLFGTDLGTGNYNALQVELEKRLAYGLQGLISYTFSKTMDNGSNTYYSSTVRNSYAIFNDYGLSDVDRPHLLSMEATYQLPLGIGQRWVHSGPLAYIAGGWQINAIGTARSGTPIVLTASGNPANVGNSVYTYAHPDLIGNPKVNKPTQQEWFNTAAFAQPVYSFGSAPRGLERNPPFQNLDMSVFKNVPVHEQISIQLRLEAFNALNLITMGNVSGSYTNNVNFGKITSIGSTPRQLQLGAKVYF
jgi:hypothetical protein